MFSRLEQVACEIRPLWVTIHKMTGYSLSPEKKQTVQPIALQCKLVRSKLYERAIRILKPYDLRLAHT